MDKLSIQSVHNLSEDTRLTLYSDGGASISVYAGVIILNAEEVQALKRAL